MAEANMDLDRRDDLAEMEETFAGSTDRREMLKRFGALALGGLAFVAATRATGADDDDDNGGRGDDDDNGGRGGRRRRGGRGGDND